MKFFRFLGVLSLALAAHAQTLSVSPSTITLGEGASVTFTANKSVTWSLPAGAVGTLSGIDATHATYTAPSAIHYSATMAGCPVTPNDSIFTQRIDSLALNANNANWTAAANIGTNTLVFDTAWGISVGTNATPLKNELFYYTTAYNSTPWLIPPVPALKRENGSYVSDQNGSDHHTVAVNTDTCKFFETYNDYLYGARTVSGQPYTATSGYSYSGTAYSLATDGTTDAAGLPLGPLTLHLDELQAGVIQHALRFTLAGGFIKADNTSFLWPATEPHFGSFSPNSPVYGARYRLKASYNISTFSAMAQTILVGLQQYGMFLADAGTGPTVTVSSDLSRNAAAMSALGSIAAAHIPLSQFEVVDESSLMIGSHSSQVQIGSASGQYGAITATDSSTSPATVVSLPIALTGVTVAVPDPYLYMAAGTYNYQLPSSVHGSTNQNVTWSLVSGVGAVTAAGLYTPPASVSAPTSVVLEAASAADATATRVQNITILPVDASGILRLDSGLTSASFNDATGATWWKNQGYEAGDYVQLNGDYPNWPAQTNPQIGVYQSESYTFGSDIEYRLIVPNGSYKVHTMYGQAYNGGSPSTCVMGPVQQTAQNVEIQNVVAAASFQYGASIGNKCATPADFSANTTVTNNQLMVAVRPISNDANRNTAVAQLNGLEIIPQSPIAPLIASPPATLPAPLVATPAGMLPVAKICDCN